jgi:uncharacterized membrane protein (UPF0136 family)
MLFVGQGTRPNLVTAYYYIFFGIVCILGGALGYARARSKASIIAGGVSGALLILAGILARGFIPYAIGIVVSVLLLAHFGRSFVASRKPMPAVPMILLSLVCIGLTVRHLIH